MSLRRKRVIIWCVFGLAFLSVLALYECPPAVQGLLTAVGLLAPLAALVLHGIWMRCPECGAYLGRSPGAYCKNCGGKLDWDAKKRKE